MGVPFPYGQPSVCEREAAAQLRGRWILRTYLDRDRLLMGSPLRRPRACKWICAVLAVVLAFAAIVNLGVFAGLRPDVLSVFDRALARSSALAIVPLAILWFLDRRERELPLLFAAAFLWGGCIATGLALPINTVLLPAHRLWVSRHPLLPRSWGRMPRCCWQPRSPRQSPKKAQRHSACC